MLLYLVESYRDDFETGRRRVLHGVFVTPAEAVRAMIAISQVTSRYVNFTVSEIESGEAFSRRFIAMGPGGVNA